MEGRGRSWRSWEIARRAAALDLAYCDRCVAHGGVLSPSRATMVDIHCVAVEPWQVGSITCGYACIVAAALRFRSKLRTCRLQTRLHTTSAFYSVTQLASRRRHVRHCLPRRPCRSDTFPFLVNIGRMPTYVRNSRRSCVPVVRSRWHKSSRC